VYKNGKKIITSEGKAIKQHRCHVCEGNIQIGEVYTTLTQIKTTKWNYMKYKTFKICLFHDINKLKIKGNKIEKIEE